MPEGFEYDPETVHARVEALRTPSTRPEDFGAALTRHGTDFRLHLAVLVEDLTHLPATLAAMGEADTTALRDLPAPQPDPEAASAAAPDGDAWEIVGEPLDERVAAVAALDLDLEPAPEAKRAELRGLHWGRIGADLTRLGELATALDDLAGHLEHDAAAATLTDYATAVRTVAAGLRSALTGARERYVTYRDESLARLDLGGAEPGAVEEKVRDWYRATDDLQSGVDDLLAPALAALRTVALARPFTADRQVLALRRQVTVVAGGDDHLTVTVADGTGEPTVYDLDFDAASGLAPEPDRAASADQDAERVRAGTNGKCVFEHNGVTITAERGLFDASTVTLTVDDGVAEPGTHTVAVPPAPEAVLVPEQANGCEQTAAAADIGWSVHGDLFDTSDPVHSVHGVLTLDDLGSQP